MIVLILPGRAVKNRDAIGQEHRLGQRVRDEDDCFAGLCEKLREIFAQHHARLLVERGERFVHEQNVGLHADAARHIHALAHADGQLVWIVARERGHADGPQRGHGAVVPFGFWNALKFKGDVKVLDHRVPGKQRAFLKHESDLVGMRFAVDEAAIDGACPGRRAKQPADHVEQGAFATPRRAEQANEFALADIERHVVEGEHARWIAFLAEPLGDVSDRDGDVATRLFHCTLHRRGFRHACRQAHSFTGAKPG